MNEKERVIDEKEIIEAAKEEFGPVMAETLKQKAVVIDDYYSKHNDLEVDFGEEDIGSSKSALNFDFITKKLEDTDHLPAYELFENDLGLDGENYKAVKKWLNYYQHSLRQNTVAYRINKKTVANNRTHGLIIASAGTGKTTIKNQVKRIMKDFQLENGVIEVSGLSHPEQLVGKIQYKGKGDKKEKVEVKGILSYKCVMNDESQDMLNECNDVYAKAQRIKRLGMDTYGENEISKKLVDDSPENVLKYNSPSRICDFAHPKKLVSAFFDTGSFRRYNAFNVSFEPKMSLNDITEFSFDNETTHEKTWKGYLDHIYTEDKNIKFNEDTLKIISHFHKCLLKFLLKHKNPNAFRYGLQTRYSLRSTFCNNVMILAMARNEITPSFYTTISACRDTMLFVLKSIETYNDLGDMGTTSDVWGGLGEQDSQALEYLLRMGYTSKDTSAISIKKFQTILANFYGCKLTQSRAHYYRLKKDGFINSCQIGQTESRVWLTYIPKDIELDCTNSDGLDFWETYAQGVGGKNALLTPLKSIFIDDKTFEKAQGDGGVGVMGCAISKYILCVEALEDKNKNNNIYTNQVMDIPDTPASPTPSTSEPITATINKGVKGVKTPKKRPTPSKLLKTDRELQFYEAPECMNIVPTCTKEQILSYLQNTPIFDYKAFIDTFGVGCLEMRNELIREGKWTGEITNG